MRPVRTLIAGLALVGMLTLSTAAATAASEYQRVLQVYERAGSIPPCEFSSPELESALKGVDSYGAQYFADFTQAIQDALSARAAGACSGAPAVSATAADQSGPGVGIPVHLGSLTAATDSGVPAPLALLGVLAVGGVLAGAVALVVQARRRGAGGAQPTTRTPTERL